MKTKQESTITQKQKAHHVAVQLIQEETEEINDGSHP